MSMCHIKVYTTRNYRDRFTASGKAKIDAEQIAECCGYNLIGTGRSHYHNGVIAYLRRLWSVVKASMRMPRGGMVFLQYPSPIDSFIKIARQRGNRIILLIHDINGLRTSAHGGRELTLLKSADVLIVHTERMREKLRSIGIDKPTVVLRIFDYLDNTLITGKFNKTTRLAYAGNLGKSEFIDKLVPVGYKLNLYGIGIDKRVLNQGVEYKGCFRPDELAANIEADFGLVWDGDSVSTCSGVLGEYLRIIAPHKLSFYLSAGLPVVVWKESAMAQFVKDNSVGIVIDSLDRLGECLANITPEEYSRLKANATDMAVRLSQGQFLKEAIRKAEALIN